MTDETSLSLAGVRPGAQVVWTVLLQIHLWFGLVGAIFLLILGFTGSVMAFEGLHPRLWYVDVQAEKLLQQDLINRVQMRFAPAHVIAVQIFRQRNLVESLEMTDRSTVLVNPYNGAILWRATGPSSVQNVLQSIHQLHLRLTPDPRAWPGFSSVGKVAVSFAGLILFVQVPIGIYLWWRYRRKSVQWKGSWLRTCFDLHKTLGLYGALFLFIAALTGILIGFDWGEKTIYTVTRSSRPARLRLPQSTVIAGTAAIGLDRALEVAKEAMPDASVAGFSVPLRANDAINVLMRVPEETSEAVHSAVSIDRYSGKVLQVRDFRKDSLGYRVIRFNRSIHTGDAAGLPTHILVSLSSLLLVAMVITGVAIWVKKTLTSNRTTNVDYSERVRR
jgi:uncharacterized iron-regulated membrane protein